MGSCSALEAKTEAEVLAPPRTLTLHNSSPLLMPSGEVGHRPPALAWMESKALISTASPRESPWASTETLGGPGQVPAGKATPPPGLPGHRTRLPWFTGGDRQAVTSTLYEVRSGTPSCLLVPSPRVCATATHTHTHTHTHTGHTDQEPEGTTSHPLPPTPRFWPTCLPT